jgi:hypothetical protein
MLERLFPQQADDKLFVEDVFSTTLYSGTGSFRGINVGISNFAVAGGMVWMKSRNSGTFGNEIHRLYDTARAGSGGGGTLVCSPSLQSNSADLNFSGSSVTFYSTGTTITVGGGNPNNSDYNYVSWTFRKAPNFFDVVTWTGNGANRTIAHNLGSAPGMMIVKRTDAEANWAVYHRGFPSPSTQYGILNDYLGTPTTATNVWNSTNPTASVFSVGTNALVNANGGTYVAYLYAHDTASTGLIQCGSFTTNGSADASVTLGWEPQWVMIKDLDNQQYYAIYDNMRGLTSAVSGSRQLFASVSNAEGTNPVLAINATGFSINQYTDVNYIYMAIRRGPMRTPTLGTSVFAPVLQQTGTITTNFPIDTQFARWTGGPYVNNTTVNDRLRGFSSTTTASDATGLITSSSAGESDAISTLNWGNTTASIPVELSGTSGIYWNFRRAPGFMDVVCYTGNYNGSNAPLITHNLGVKPELIIQKKRFGTSAFDWFVVSDVVPGSGIVRYGILNTGAAFQSINSGLLAPTQTGFPAFQSSDSCVAYLFASVPGVSKVGTYTGNGSSQTINCAFTTGARFVLIKRTDSTGDWWVWDTARGIVSANDPALRLNSTAAETTGIDSVDPDSTGFVVNQDSTTNINVNAATYIFLAIA